MSCVDGITSSVSVVPELKVEELWGQRCIHTNIWWSIRNFRKLGEISALNKVFFLASKSTDLLPLSASTFPALGGIPALLPSNGSDCVQHKFSVFVSLRHDYLWCCSISSLDLASQRNFYLHDDIANDIAHDHIPNDIAPCL